MRWLSDKHKEVFLLVLVLREVSLENLPAVLDLAAKHKVSCQFKFLVERLENVAKGELGVWGIQQQVKEFRPHGSIVHPGNRWKNQGQLTAVIIKKCISKHILSQHTFVLNGYKCWFVWPLSVHLGMLARLLKQSWRVHIQPAHIVCIVLVCVSRHDSPWYTLVWPVETTGRVFDHLHVVSMHEYKHRSCNTKIVHLQKKHSKESIHRVLRLWARVHLEGSFRGFKRSNLDLALPAISMVFLQASVCTEIPLSRWSQKTWSPQEKLGCQWPCQSQWGIILFPLPAGSRSAG